MRRIENEIYSSYMKNPKIPLNVAPLSHDRRAAFPGTPPSLIFMPLELAPANLKLSQNLQLIITNFIISLN